MTVFLALAILALVALYLTVSSRSERLRRAAGVVKSGGIARGGDRVGLAVAGFLSGLAVWQLASDLIHDPLFLPGPAPTLISFFQLWGDAATFYDALATVRRVGVAVAIAGSIGLIVGTLATVFPRFGNLVLPLNSAIRYIPPTAFISLAILWFGIGEAGRVALIGLAIVWYVVQMVADTLRQVPRSLIESAELLGASRTELLTEVFVPYCLPELLAVIRINVGAAWTFVVVAELVTAQDGLGYALALNQRLLQTPRVFALILTISLIGFLTDAILAAGIRWLGRWK